MPGISTIIAGIKGSVAQLRSDTNVKTGDLQKQVDELRVRLDKYDKPAASSFRKAPASKKKSAKKRPVPVPEKPDVLKAAEEAAEE